MDRDTKACQPNDVSTHGGNSQRPARCLSLLSGGLDSMLAVCVLRAQGAHVEGVFFDSPFFDLGPAQRAAHQLNLPLHVVDFTADILDLLDTSRHGFGGQMNPCIDCHACMLKRAGEQMVALGFDCLATGEVVGQRPMSQTKSAMGRVLCDSGIGDDVVRPLSAKLLAPSRVELEGLLDRERLLRLSGRSRKPQLALAAAYGVFDYPAPAGGCLLTDVGYCRRLRDLEAHEGMRYLHGLWLLRLGRHLRLPGGTKCIVGRNKSDNEALASSALPSDTLLHAVDVRGPTVLLPGGARDRDDLTSAARVCAAYGSPGPAPTVNIRVTVEGHEEIWPVAVVPRTEFAVRLI